MDAGALFRAADGSALLPSYDVHTGTDRLLTQRQGYDIGRSTISKDNRFVRADAALACAFSFCET